MKKFFKIIFITFIALIVIGIIFGDTEEKNLQKLEVIKTAKIDKISPSGELYQIYSFGSNYTDLQRDNMTKDLKDKIVQWTLPVFEVNKLAENKYKIQTNSGTTFGTRYVGTFTVVYTQNENEVQFIENLKTGSNITIKGIINDTFMRHIEIEPAILILE
ncbi:hypothetical protein [Arcobacter sp. CECT 9188]|uniref:hypothetical protein n=1 Tax=Arcobacter sp. CECT 9188 TaxID=2044505 RepID=UPI000DEA4700|nr:hypothetical protein [Arcobacter sp. CECT 9188]RBQ26355.1 hypothetical protein CRU88_07725 [Arcobacter sp. CECT 9188]